MSTRTEDNGLGKLDPENSSLNNSDRHETKKERAARIRANQRRSRERKLAYVIHLEEQIRRHEAVQMKETTRLQMLARKLDFENRKMKKALAESCGFLETEIDENDEGKLIEKMRRINGKPPLQSRAETLDNGLSAGIMGHDSSFYTPLFHGFSSTSESQVQNPLTPPMSVSELTPTSILTLVPRPPSDVLSSQNQAGGPQRLSDLLQLVPSDEAVDLSTVTCYVSYEVLKSLMDERNLDSGNGVRDQIHSEVEAIAEYKNGYIGDMTDLLENGK